MQRLLSPLLRVPLWLALAALAAGSVARPGDWPEWRGPHRDGVSEEKNLTEKWSPAGENLLWRAPFGGRSAPVVLGDRVFIQNTAGKGETIQERVMAFQVASGKLLWEYRWNIFLSDSPPHRVGWASPAADAETGNVYAFSVGGTLVALSPNGKLLWERSLTEEVGLITTHGGRTVSPIIDGDLVIVSGIAFSWGVHSRGSHKFYAFDKRSGECVWASAPASRPYDTTYSQPIIVEINGSRLLIAGASDGAVYALKPRTGEMVWRYEISKRGINTGAIVLGHHAILTHSEENLDTSEMGLITAVDAAATGTLGLQHVKWALHGVQGGFSSPVSDGQRIYQVDNGANLFAFDAATGKQLWTLNLGTIQRASPVLADGKLYVGTENGKFFILRPRADGCDILDQDQLGTEADPEEILGSAAVSRGRIFLVTMDALYAIGGRAVEKPLPAAPASPVASAARSNEPPAYVQVVPTELILKPGERVRFKARLFDAKGKFIRESEAVWSLEQLGGSIEPVGSFTAGEGAYQAGFVKATVGQLAGTARVRVFPPLPWKEDFESLKVEEAPRSWVNAAQKYAVRQVEGNKVLVKLWENQNSFYRRARAFIGPTDGHDYTVQADVRAAQRRRQMGDVGIVAQRYALVLFANHQRLDIQSWQPETSRSVSVPFAWQGDTWYRMKLRIENLPNGRVRVQGKVWPASEPEPGTWTIEKLDATPNRHGSPGLYGDAPFDIYFDNLVVMPNSAASK